MKWMSGCHINVSNDKEMFDYSNCWTSSKHYNNSKKIVVSIIKNETAGAATE